MFPGELSTLLFVCSCYLLIFFGVFFIVGLVLWCIHHKVEPNDISGAVIILGKMLICLAFLVRYGIWSVATCDNYIVIPSGSLAVMSFDIMTGAIVDVDWFSRWMLVPEYEIASVYFLGELGGVCCSR